MSDQTLKSSTPRGPHVDQVRGPWRAEEPDTSDLAHVWGPDGDLVASVCDNLALEETAMERARAIARVPDLLGADEAEITERNPRTPSVKTRGPLSSYVGAAAKARALCYAIEGLPASDEQTMLVQIATELEAYLSKKHEQEN